MVPANADLSGGGPIGGGGDCMPIGGAAGGIPIGGPCIANGAGGGGGAESGGGAPNPGASPTMVPLRFAFPAAAGGADCVNAAAATGAAGGAIGGAAGGAGGGADSGLFIINIVPLNFGALPGFKVKPHFVQLLDVSGFCVPQFGQNTLGLRWADDF